MQRKKRLPNTRDEAVFFEYEGVAWVASTPHKPANAWQAHQNTFVRSEPFCRVCKAELLPAPGQSELSMALDEVRHFGGILQCPVCRSLYNFEGPVRESWLRAQSAAKAAAAGRMDQASTRTA
jgi:hypothetical protein